MDSVRCAAGSPPRRPAAIVARTGAQGRVSRTFDGWPLRAIHRFSPAAAPAASLTVCGHVRPTRPKGFGQRAPRGPRGSWRASGEKNTRKSHQPSPVPLRGILAAADDCLRPLVPVAPDSVQSRRPSPRRSESCSMGWRAGTCPALRALAFPPWRERERQDLPQGDPHRIVQRDQSLINDGILLPKTFTESYWGSMMAPMVSTRNAKAAWAFCRQAADSDSRMPKSTPPIARRRVRGAWP